jgi:hypothetical protein
MTRRSTTELSMTERSMAQARTLGQEAGTRRSPRGSIRLTGRGAAVALFAACFLGLLVAAWTGWDVLADLLFVMVCGVVACYTRVSGLRGLVVCPPLAFFTGCVLAQVLTAADTFSALTGMLITLGGSALWLFTGTALTLAIALGRGWRPQGAAARSAAGNLRAAVRDVRPRADRWVERS